MCAVLQREGLLHGEIRKYPFIIYDALKKKNRRIKNGDQLAELIYSTLAKLRRENPKQELKNALFMCGVGENCKISTAQLLDSRTAQLLSLYQYYKNNPTSFCSDPPRIWFDTVNALNKIYEVRL